jgi:uncharacterized protein YjbI with pentapeptide repeats
MLRIQTKGMSQLKPMIIVLLMLTSALAGCTGTDTTDLEQQIADLQQSNDEMNETIYNMEITLQEKNSEIATLNSNVVMLQSSIADAETYRDSLLVLLENSNTSNDELESMIEAANNSILVLQSDLVVQQNLVVEWQQTAEDNRADLSYAMLSGAVLSGADLSNADLSYANLRNAQLQGVDLYGADLSGANLYGADLSGADLSGADLSYAILYEANLTSADLSNADLENVMTANLQGCPAILPTDWQCVRNNLVGPYADLSYAQLQGADLYGANLTGANLYAANLSNADLFGANLWAADLSNADLRNADLSYAVLNYANLSDADLSDADLSDVNWDWATCPDGTAAYYHGQTCENNIALYSNWLFIGDSDIEEWGTSQYIDSSNIGDGGSTCNDTLSSIDEVLEQYTPVHVVIVCGENDLWQRTVEDTFEDFQAIVNKIILSGASVTYMGTKAEPATTELHAEYREYDSLIQDSAVNLANNSYAPLNVVDVYQGFEDIGNPNSLYQDDELHLSLDGYEYWNQWLVQISNDSDCIIWQSQECRVSIE